MSKNNIFEFAERELPYKAVAMETIDFQKNDFGKELEAFFQGIVDTCKTEEDVRKEENQNNLSAIVKKYTNLTITCNFSKEANFIGAAVLLPGINRNNILLNDHRKDVLPGIGLDKILKSFEKHNALNKVDLKTGKVYGIFEDIPAIFYFAAPWFLFYELTVREQVAITLHEIGHLFTYFEYSNRTVTTNQVLASLSKELTNITDTADKVLAVHSVEETLGFKKRLDDKLIENKDNATILVELVAKCLEEEKSLMGIGAYDETSSESLADAYAARHGYAREIATGLDKLGLLLTSRSATLRTMAYMLSTIHILLVVGTFLIAAATGAAVLIGSLLLSLGLFSSKTDSRDFTYDDAPTRLKRLKEQLIQMSKDPLLDKETLAYIVEGVKVIENISSNTFEFNGFLRVIGDFLFNKSKRLADHIKLQNDLEALASNELFLSAAKLRLLA